MNAFVDEEETAPPVEIFRLDPGVLERQQARLAEVKRTREERRARDALRAIEEQAPNLKTNLMPYVEEAVRARCTVGEICDVLRGVWGEFKPLTVF